MGKKISSRNSSKETKEKNIFNSLAIGTIFAYFITLLVFIIYSLLITYTDVTEKYMQTIIMVTTVISVLVSGFLSTKNIKSKGLLIGILSGVIYFIILLIVAFCILPTIEFNSKLLTLLILSICSGGIGGIIGINLK